MGAHEGSRGSRRGGRGGRGGGREGKRGVRGGEGRALSLSPRSRITGTSGRSFESACAHSHSHLPPRLPSNSARNEASLSPTGRNWPEKLSWRRERLLARKKK